MGKEINVNEWIKRFNNGEFESISTLTQIKAGWYDWFCRETSLRNKTKYMGNIIKKLKSNENFDLNNVYVWFKNNCPLAYPLYDDFRIADLETGKVLFTIQIKSPWSDFNYSVYSHLNDFKDYVLETNSRKELLNFLNNVKVGN